MNMNIPYIKSLSNLTAGETGKIVRVSGKPDFHRYLHQKGITIGRKISVRKIGAPFSDDCLTIHSGGKTNMIGRDNARYIKVRVAR